MMSGDCQSQGLAEWLQSLGWSGDLQPKDLRKLNSPNMRSIWRHLQAHVVPSQTASTIRRNVLLARLKKEKIPVGQLANIKLDSVNQLSKVKEILKIEDKKDEVKEKIKMIDEKLQTENSIILKKHTLEELEKYKLNEIEEKTTILEMKHARLLRDSKQVEIHKETAMYLKSPKNSISHNELNYQKSLVSKYVKNYRYPFKDNDDDSEYLCEMMVSILGFKPEFIYSGIAQNAKESIRVLSAKVPFSMSVGDSVSFSTTKTFQKKLKALKVLVVRNQLNIKECVEKILFERNELKKEKAKLVETFNIKDNGCSYLEKNSGFDGVEDGNTENYSKRTNEETYKNDSNVKGIKQLLDQVLSKIQEEKKKLKILEEQNLLMPDEEYEPVEELEQSVRNLVEKEEELWREVEKKVSEVNLVAAAVYSNLADFGLNGVISEILLLASDFKTEISQVLQKGVSSSEFSEMMLREIEVFQKTPMIALHRKWDTSNKMLRVCSAKKFFNNPSLLHFLLQSEEKNLITNVLMKYLWSLYINPQFL